MSLIQEALERAGRLPDYKSEAPDPSGLAAVTAKSKKMPGLPKPEMNKERLRKVSFILAALACLALACLALACAAGWVYFAPLPKAFPKKTIPKAVWGGGLSLVGSQPISAQKPQFKLTGITYSSNKEPLALINNQVLGVGERLDKDTVVKEIQRKTVTLEFRGTAVTLTL